MKKTLKNDILKIVLYAGFVALFLILVVVVIRIMDVPLDLLRQYLGLPLCYKQ